MAVVVLKAILGIIIGDIMANYGLLDTSIPGQAQNTLASAFKQTQDTLKAGRLSDLQFQQAERQGQVGDLQLQSAQRDAARDTQLDAYIKSPEVQALQQEPNKAAAYQKFMDGLMRNGGFQSPEMAMTYMKNRAEKEKPIPRPQHGMIDPNTFEVVVEPIPDKVETKFDANYPIGDNKVQPHYSRDQGVTWQPVEGSKPSAKFAKQIPSVVVGGDSGKFTNIQSDGAGGFLGFNPATRQIENIPMADGAVGKGGSINLAGGRESTQINRVVMAANQVAKDLKNVSSLPTNSSRGWFGGREQGKGLFSANKETLANMMTTQDVQTYNVMATGLQRNLAAIEAAGLMPSGSLTHQMDAIIFKEGDTNLTKMQKMAQIRQIADAGLETIESNPRVAKETKDHIADVRKKLDDAVPYTQQALMELQIAQDADPNATLSSVMKAMKRKDGTTPSAPKGAAVPVRSEDEALSLPAGTRFKLPDGRTGTAQ